MLESLKELMKTDEFKENLKTHFKKIEDRESINKIQLERFHKKYHKDFKKILTLVLDKYNSNEYKDRWYNRGIEPEEYLKDFLFGYAKKYGRSSSKKEIKKYGNVFTVELYYINGFYFNLMSGQGSYIQIIEE